MASLFMIVVQLLPAICMVSIIILYQGINIPVHWKVSIARTLFRLKSWCMVEIFLAGVLVSFVKLMAYGDVGVGTSFIPYVLFCLLQLRAFQCTDRFWLWQHIEPAPAVEHPVRVGESGLRQGLRSCHCCMAILPVDQKECGRCKSHGHARRKNSLQWTMALLVTSVLLYLPANLLPIMITQVLGTPMPSTIMAGVVLLWSDGSYPVAMVIFIASIMVPTLKMIAIAWLCWDANSNKEIDRERLHVIYELVEFVGRWSMIDVFVIAVLSALVRMGQLMSIYPDIGALLFAGVVILTMFAAMTFDPRLIWDRAGMKSTKEPQDGRK
jgi:paraquat-inducible protein A